MKLHFAFKGMFELAWVSVVCFGSRERVQRYLIQLIVQIKSLSSANWETDWLGNQRWTSCPSNPQQAPNSVFWRRLTPERTLKAFLKQDYTLIGALQFTADAEQDKTEVWMLSRYMTSSTLPLRQRVRTTGSTWGSLQVSSDAKLSVNVGWTPQASDGTTEAVSDIYMIISTASSDAEQHPTELNVPSSWVKIQDELHKPLQPQSNTWWNYTCYQRYFTSLYRYRATPNRTTTNTLRLTHRN